MKKVLALLLAATLVLTMSVTAFAANGVSGPVDVESAETGGGVSGGGVDSGATGGEEEMTAAVGLWVEAGWTEAVAETGFKFFEGTDVNTLLDDVRQWIKNNNLTIERPDIIVNIWDEYEATSHPLIVKNNEDITLYGPLIQTYTDGVVVEEGGKLIFEEGHYGFDPRNIAGTSISGEVAEQNGVFVVRMALSYTVEFINENGETEEKAFNSTSEALAFAQAMDIDKVRSISQSRVNGEKYRLFAYSNGGSDKSILIYFDALSASEESFVRNFVADMDDIDFSDTEIRTRYEPSWSYIIHNGEWDPVKKEIINKTKTIYVGIEFDGYAKGFARFQEYKEKYGSQGFYIQLRNTPSVGEVAKTNYLRASDYGSKMPENLDENVSFADQYSCDIQFALEEFPELYGEVIKAEMDDWIVIDTYHKEFAAYKEFKSYCFCGDYDYDTDEESNRIYQFDIKKEHLTQTKSGREQTCGQSGWDSCEECMHCGKVLSYTNYRAATGEHNYGEDGKCTGCDAVRTELKAEDIPDNGNVSVNGNVAGITPEAAGKGTGSLVIQFSNGISFTIGKKTLDQITEGDKTIDFAPQEYKVENLPDAQRKTVEEELLVNDNLFNKAFQFTHGFGKEILFGDRLYVTVDYNPDQWLEDENGTRYGVVAYWIDANGKKEKVQDFTFDWETKSARLGLDHFSTYVITQEPLSEVPEENTHVSSGGGAYMPAGHTVTSPFTGVDKVYVDGVLVDAAHYTTYGGNIILNQKYLDGLKAGTHTVKIVYGERTSTGTFTTKGAGTVQSAKTFDAGVAVYGMMALASAAGAVYVTGRKR